MSKILYVEDEVFLAKIVKETLEKEGYVLRHVLDGNQALTAFQSFEPDICLLDVMLPNRNGFEIAVDIRKKSERIPILFLTAKDQTEDLLEGFQSGGNDYIKKPFSMEELMVRIENLIKLSKGNEGQNRGAGKSLLKEITLGESFVFYPQKLSLDHPSEKKTLSMKESQILEILCQNKNAIVERKSILMSVWNEDSYFNSRTLDVYIRELRKHFAIDPSVQIITLKGVGYQFVG